MELHIIQWTEGGIPEEPVILATEASAVRKWAELVAATDDQRGRDPEDGDDFPETIEGANGFAVAAWDNGDIELRYWKTTLDEAA